MTDRRHPSDDIEWSFARREFLADERDRVADARDALADLREADADVRELEAHLAERDVVTDGAVAAADRTAERSARLHAADARLEARETRAAERQRRSTDAPTILARLFADIARQLFEPGPLDAILGRIAAVATDLVPGCECASVTITSRQGPTTVASTAPVAAEADRRQYTAAEGPCLDAMEERSVYTPDLGADPRWPHLDTTGLAVRSVASLGLYDPWRAADERDAQRASLNLYASPIDAISETGREMG